ncbi:hypothetical protein EYF80_056075 [Liparis tanakae]|uniref:Uncharacterized protein n=1 Tax=Liparis tanakae TaxID=230148 RepID=A0A4Z2EZF6_9TELE|nr:hypothetical protein EYF80_056075 [Liparis tanakae]
MARMVERSSSAAAKPFQSRSSWAEICWIWVEARNIDITVATMEFMAKWLCCVCSSTACWYPRPISRQNDMLLWRTPAAADRGSLPLPRRAAELTSRKSHIWLESQRFTTLK